jgi:hypothetical protein
LARSSPARDKDEVVGDIEALDMKPHAARRNIGDQAIARQCAVADLNLRHAVDAAPVGATPLGGIS